MATYIMIACSRTTESDKKNNGPYSTSRKHQTSWAEEVGWEKEVKILKGQHINAESMDCHGMDEGRYSEGACTKRAMF